MERLVNYLGRILDSELTFSSIYRAPVEKDIKHEIRLCLYLE